MASEPQRVALVTGGSRGIGRAVVEALLDEGYAVAFCSRSAGSVAEAQAALLARWPDRVTGEAVDVRQQSQVASWVAAAADRLGRIDCLVNNAGLGTFGPVDEIAPESFREVIETNLLGPYYAMAAAAPIMRKQGGGWIFNVGSLAAKNAFAGGAAYNASKFGLLGLSEASMLDLRHAGIRIAAILPGSVDTDFHSDRRPEREWMLAPEDVARAIVDLLRYPGRALPSLVELRPSRPPKK
ncbi:MAG TPA: SDR family oxidoreductase [Thermoanaerobaculia bacterium]|nr:SDR family oxidoreductase [Thermoanaerobaculia bacterium]